MQPPSMGVQSPGVRTSRAGTDASSFRESGNLTFDKSGTYLTGVPSPETRACFLSPASVDRAVFDWPLVRPSNATGNVSVGIIKVMFSNRGIVYGVVPVLAMREARLFSPDGTQLMMTGGAGFGAAVGNGATVKGEFPWGTYRVELRLCAGIPQEWTFEAVATYGTRGN